MRFNASTVCRLLAIGLLLGAAMPVLADEISGDPQALIDQWTVENDACRGGSGDDDKTWEACDRRDAVVDQLRQEGWCYGHDGQAEYERDWEECQQ